MFWGDTHVHTSYSTDAGMLGNRLGPDEAYRFARGEVVVSSTGVRARLVRPLDFLVVADHSENLGLAPMIVESNPDLLRTDFGRRIHGLVKSGEGIAAFTLWGEGMNASQDPLAGNDALVRSHPQPLCAVTRVWLLVAFCSRSMRDRVFHSLVQYQPANSSTWDS